MADAPTITLKIKGLQALQTLNGLGGLKINGANALMLGGMEGNRAAMMMNMGDNGNRAMMAGRGMMREMEMEGNRMMLSKGGGAMAKGTMAQSGATLGATKSATAAATTKSVTSASMFGTKGIGSLWLGGLGPWLVLTSLGLAATGIYFYLRAQRMMLEGNGHDSDADD
jgi:hypothetical protein